MTQIARLTPVEIDTRLAGLYRQAAAMERSVTGATLDLHYALSERKTRRYGQWEWPTTDAEVLAACRKAAANDEQPDDPWWYPRKSLARYDDAAAKLAEIERRAEPFNTEWDRRGGWTRFFTVQQSGGHIHASMNCSTCNRGGNATRFAWNPELSGRSETEALALLGRAGHTMCTVCFPNAPILPPALDPRQCQGTRDATAETRECGQSRYGRCADCGTWQMVTLSGALRKHRKVAE